MNLCHKYFQNERFAYWHRFLFGIYYQTSRRSSSVGRAPDWKSVCRWFDSNLWQKGLPIIGSPFFYSLDVWWNHCEHNIGYYSDTDKKRVFFIKISFCYSPRSFSHVFTSSLLKLIGKRSHVIQFLVLASFSSRFLLSPVPVDIDVQDAITFLPVKLLFLTKPSITHAASHHQIG